MIGWRISIYDDVCFANRMLDVYRREYPEFIRSISEGAVTQVPDAMKEEAERLLNSESYII